MAGCINTYELIAPNTRPVLVPFQKDYSTPLHVDCSVEYELPNQAKPPQDVRNEPLLMIHPCYFRKIESQRRSPFVNNLPARSFSSAKKKMYKSQPNSTQLVQPQQGSRYPAQCTAERFFWDPFPQLLPVGTQTIIKKDSRNTEYSASYNKSEAEAVYWTDINTTDNKSILAAKYRQYIRTHRLHPYVTPAIPLASTFPPIQQICYNA